jgi:formylglycine-generating enzyme required for sulfatase activity
MGRQKRLRRKGRGGVVYRFRQRRTAVHFEDRFLGELSTFHKFYFNRVGPVRKGRIVKKAFVMVSLMLTMAFHSNAATPYAGMKIIPSAKDSFLMGFNSDSTQGPEAIQWGPYSCVMGAHWVKFTYNFYMDSTMVTQADFQALMGFNPSGFKGSGQLPVESLTWYDAVLYCNARSKRDNLDTVYKYTSISKSGQDATNIAGLTYDITKNGYRVPTNAEYEYATRAHTPGDWFFTPVTVLGWTQALNNAIVTYSQPYCWSSQTSTHAVATLKPNPFGLYDMRGNAFEWENDFEAPYLLTTQTDPVGAASGNQNTATCGNSGSDASSKMCCGGSYSDDVCNHERTQYHYHWSANTKNNQISFRCSATSSAVGINKRTQSTVDFHWLTIAPGRFSTKIEYALENQGLVKIAVFDCKGSLVRMLVSGSRSAGTYSTLWDCKNDIGKSVGAGSYIISVSAGQRYCSKTVFWAN